MCSEHFPELAESERDFLRKLIQKTKDLMRPDMPQTIWQWADKYRILPQTSSTEPGKYRTERTPYLKEPLDCLLPTSPVERVIIMKSVQLGFTEGFHNWLGYLIDSGRGGPTMHVMPTIDVASRNIQQKIQPMLEETPQLREKLAPYKSRDGGNSRFFKIFPGGIFISTGANSSASFRNVSIKNLCLDEIDGYPVDCGEGPPEDLAIGRTDGFSDRKILIISTPTYEATSRIKKYYSQSDQRKYFVPCPCCHYYQTLEFDNLVWEEGKPHKGVRYKCASCDELFEEYHKSTMLDRGRWVAKFPGYMGGKIAGFHINGLYSPNGMLSWEDIARKWEDSKGNESKVVAFTNTVKGETYTNESQALDWEMLFAKRERYRIGSVPDDEIVYLFAGADVQGDRVEVGIWGVKAFTKEFFAIDHRILDGSTNESYVWAKLDGLMNEHWTTPKGFLRKINLILIDAGYNTQRVYNWCRKYPHTRVKPIVGDAKLKVVISHPRMLEKTNSGHTIKQGLRAWHVGVNLIKEEVSGWLTLQKLPDATYPNHYVHYPEFDEEWCKQMSAEALVLRTTPSGERTYVWERSKHKRCEAWDTFVYARAAAFAFGVERFNYDNWRAALKQLNKNTSNLQSDNSDEISHNDPSIIDESSYKLSPEDLSETDRHMLESALAYERDKAGWWDDDFE